MSNSTNAVGRGEMYYLCCANNTAEDQLAELARLVGGGGSAPKETLDTITLLDDAPKLEFDLEQELSKAFASVPYSSPEHAQAVTEPPSLNLSPVLEEPTPSAPDGPAPALEAQVQPDQVKALPEEQVVAVVEEEISGSDMDLGDLISKEFELALQEEITPPVSETETELVDAIEQASDKFDSELARLMGSTQDAPGAAKTPPPIPELTVAPPDEPVIVTAPIVPSVSEPEIVVSEVSDSLAAQMSDFDSPQVIPAAQDELEQAELEHALESIPAALDIPQVASVDPVVEFAETNQDVQSTVDPTAAAPIVHSEINIQDLNDSNPSFHEDEISIPEPHAAAMVEGNSKAGRRAAGSLVAVALVAGLGLAGWNAVGGDGQSVPTILASSKPVKIKPKDAGGTVVPNQDQAVYRSVESSKKVEPKQESLTDNSEKPIVVAKKADAGAGKSETRINRNELSTDSTVILTPRKVRTVVVKPDGTILTQTSDGNPKLALKTATDQPESEAPKLKIKEALPEPTKVAINKVEPKIDTEAKKPETMKKPEPAKKIEAVKKPAPVEKVAVVEKLVPTPKIVAEKKPEPVKKIAAVTKQEPAKNVEVAKKPAPAKKVASVKKPAPAPKPAKKASESVTSTASVNSPYAVQVASQRSPEAAVRTYKVLARRYASVFRGKSMDIRKADIKGKGIYYRARIPAQSKASARNICRQLKAKGGDCFVTR